MKKIFKIENLDCANCASKIEDKIKKLEGVISVSVGFITQKLTLEVEDYLLDKTVDKVQEIVKKIDSNSKLVVK